MSNYQPEFQLTSTPSFWEKLKGNDVAVLSTVKLPISLPGGDYETCIFYCDGETNVLERHQTKEQAISRHYIYEKMYKLS